MKFKLLKMIWGRMMTASIRTMTPLSLPTLKTVRTLLAKIGVAVTMMSSGSSSTMIAGKLRARSMKYRYL